MCQNTQFNLRIVRADQNMLRVRSAERLAQAAAGFLANRDVLQIRLGTADPSRSGDRLLEMRADFTVLTDQRLHTLDIGGIELCQITILQHRLDDRMLISDFFQNIGARAVTALSFFTRRQFQSFKEHITELIRGLDIETTTRVRVYFFLQLVSLCLQFLPDFIQKCVVRANSFRFHPGQHFDQRQLCLTKDPLQVFFPHFYFLRRAQLRSNL